LDGRQLQIQWSTAALWPEAVKAIFQAASIALLSEFEHFAVELFGVALDQLFDQSRRFIFLIRTVDQDFPVGTADRELWLFALMHLAGDHVPPC
jgi:hypothetical protein